MKHFSIALLGFGTVGSGVYRIISENGPQISHREGIALSIGRILVRDFEHEPNLALAPMALYTTDFNEIINDPSIDIIVECMGGIEPAKTFIIRALEAGKTVVTSNKEVMSKNWPAFEKAGKATGAGLYLEATVGGGIPIIRTLLDSMQANNITSVMGIINGTTNYILTQMTETGQSFADALKDAQALGYAEANPTADVEGYDAMYKLSILSSISFHAHVPIDVIYREGITKLTRADFETAQMLNYRIKLLAIGKKTGNRIEVRVHPTMIPATHPLASVRGVFNAIFLTGHAVDDVMLYGRGAGCMPTASAVVSDIINACHNERHHKYMTFVNEESISGEIEPAGF
ncbi:MAG: homoserine dehydrogenase [Eubacteriales bacterium]